jgi:hypothetical protein
VKVIRIGYVIAIWSRIDNGLIVDNFEIEDGVN